MDVRPCNTKQLPTVMAHTQIEVAASKEVSQMTTLGLPKNLKVGREQPAHPGDLHVHPMVRETLKSLKSVAPLAGRNFSKPNGKELQTTKKSCKW